MYFSHKKCFNKVETVRYLSSSRSISQCRQFFSIVNVYRSQKLSMHLFTIMFLNMVFRRNVYVRIIMYVIFLLKITGLEEDVNSKVQRYDDLLRHCKRLGVQVQDIDEPLDESFGSKLPPPSTEFRGITVQELQEKLDDLSSEDREAMEQERDRSLAVYHQTRRQNEELEDWVCYFYFLGLGA